MLRVISRTVHHLIALMRSCTFVCVWMVVGTNTAVCTESLTTKERFTIGVENTLDPWFFVQTFAPTVAHLRKQFPELIIRTEILPANQLLHLAQERKIDALISTSGLYAFARNDVGAQHIATRRHPLASNPARSSGAIFLVRKESNFHSLRDLEAKRVTATAAESFDGWVIALGELLRYTDQPESFFSQTIFTDYAVPDPIAQLLAGEADMAVIKMCELERQLATGERDPATLSQLRVLEPRSRTNDEPRCLHSTNVYPELVFSSLPHADPSTVEDIALALLSMPTTQDGWSWGLSNTFASVDRLYKDLRVGPYEYLRRTDWRYFLETYQSYVYGLLAFALFIVIHVVRTNRLVTLRTAQLRETLAAKELAEKEALRVREKLARHDRLTIIASMSNMIVHELTQPITSLVNFTAGLRLYLHGHRDETVEALCQRIEKQAQRIAEIVRSVRVYARGEKAPTETFQLLEAIKRAVATFEQSALAADVILVQRWESTDVYFSGSSLEIELLVLNLLKNAAAATKKEIDTTQIVEPTVEIAAKMNSEGLLLIISDNGPPLTEEAFHALSEPSSRLPGEGLGLGLNLCRSIVEHHALHLTFHRNPKRGIQVLVLFPKDALS